MEDFGMVGLHCGKQRQKACAMNGIDLVWIRGQQDGCCGWCGIMPPNCGGLQSSLDSMHFIGSLKYCTFPQKGFGPSCCYSQPTFSKWYA